MATNFKTQLEKINEAALFFGTSGYHVEVSIYGKAKSAVLTIFYNEKASKEDINAKLCQFKDEGDVIVHTTFPKIASCSAFYTMKLRKDAK